MATFVLVQSPHAPDSTWLAVAEILRTSGHRTVTPSLAGLATAPAPYWPRYVEAVAAACPGEAEPPVVAGHSGAGPLLPAIGARLAGVARYIFVDAGLPADGYRRDRTITPEEWESPAFRDAATRGEVPNPWRSAALWRRVGVTDRDEAATLAAATPPIPAAMNSEAISVPPGWPDAPCVYLAFTPNPFYAPVVEQARGLGWDVDELPGAHFHMLIDPAAVASRLLRWA